MVDDAFAIQSPELDDIWGTSGAQAMYFMIVSDLPFYTPSAVCLTSFAEAWASGHCNFTTLWTIYARYRLRLCAFGSILLDCLPA